MREPANNRAKKPALTRASGGQGARNENPAVLLTSLMDQFERIASSL